MTAVGIPLGLTFIQPPEDEQTENKANPKEIKPKLSLVLSKRSSTVFLVEALAVDEGKDKDVSLTDESSFDSAIEVRISIPQIINEKRSTKFIKSPEGFGFLITLH